jgi:hypothetical protein
MKITVEIADALLDEAKRVAAREGTTVPALIEQGLRRALAERRRGSRFRLRRASFRAKGLQPGVSELAWVRVRELVYEGRGG